MVSGELGGGMKQRNLRRLRSLEASTLGEPQFVRLVMVYSDGEQVGEPVIVQIGGRGMDEQRSNKLRKDGHETAKSATA